MDDLELHQSEQNQTLKEVQEQTASKEFDSFILSLEKPDVSTQDVRLLISELSRKYPQVDKNFQEFQGENSKKILKKLNGLKKNPEKSNITLSPNQVKEYTQSGEVEIKSKEKEILQKLLQIDLMKDVTGMYKEYLEDILKHIKLNVTSKNERYTNQIGVISKEIDYLQNLGLFLGKLHNFDELKRIDFSAMVEKLMVSEEKISQTGFLDQPITSLWRNDTTVSGVNKGYEDIKKLLLTQNLTPEKAQEIKLKIFEKIRGFDSAGVDDDTQNYNSSEAIVSRITPNILNNKELRKNSETNSSFHILQNFSEKQKADLTHSIKSGKEGLRDFIKSTNILDELKFTSRKESDNFVNDLYKNIKENLNSFDEKKTKESLVKEVNTRFEYLLKRVPEKEKIVILNEQKQALKDENISKQVEKVKQEFLFKIFERVVINRTLETQTPLVEKLSKTDTALNLYRNIEGIGKMSDKTYNDIITKGQFVIEQIALMYVSGVIGGLAVKGASYTELVASLPTTGVNLKNTAMLATSLSSESLVVYLSYTGMNGLINEKQASQAFDKLNNYDFARNIIFLGVLKNIPLDKMKQPVNTGSRMFNEVKNTTLDTGALLGTDIVVRASLGELMGKEGIPRDVDGKYTWESAGDFITEELKFIVPFIIGLRQAEKGVGKLFENGKTPKITVTPTQDEFIIQIEGLQKEIRTLRQQRNIARNRGIKPKEINKKLNEKQQEYKELKQNAEQSNQTQNGPQTSDSMNPILQNNSSQKLKEDPSKSKDKNNANDKVNLNAGNKTIQEMLKGNVESVMKGFDVSKQSLSRSFEELLSKGGDKQKAEELISQEVDVRVKQLEKDGVKIDPVEGELFIARFKEERIAEFEQLIKIKETGGQIPENMKVSYKGREWDLKLIDVNKMNEVITRIVDKSDMDKYRENGKDNEFKK